MIDSIMTQVLRMKRFFYRPVYIALVAGVFMGSAFINQVFWWAGIIGLAVLVYAVTHLHCYKSAFWAGALAGSIKMFFVYSWFWTVYPFDWMGNFSHILQLGAILWVWLIASVGTGVSLSVFTLVLFLKIKGAYRYLVFPLVYVASELFGSILFSFVESGPGSTLNTETSFGYLGYTLARHGIFGSLAEIFGVYMLSFMVALVALCLADSVALCERNPFHRIRNVAIVSGIFILCIGSYFTALPASQAQKNLTVVTVNSHYINAFQPTSAEKANRVREMITAFKAALQVGSDVIIFPETAYALTVFGSPDNIFSYIASQTDDQPLVIDSDGTISAQGEPVIRATLYDMRTKSTHSVFKEFLVPTGEYVPYHLSLLMKLAGFTEVREYLSKAMAFKRNESIGKQGIVPEPGVLFCSEVLSSKLVYQASKRATLPLLVHPVSHGWFHNPLTLWYQLDLILRTQARFSGLPIVQAANMWESRAYNENGYLIPGTVVFESEYTTVVRYDL